MSETTGDLSPRDRLLQEVIDGYLAARDAGRPPDREDLLARNPEIAEDLRAFFTDDDRMRRITGDSQTPAALPVLRPAPLPVVAGYDDLEEIGRGGMGIVYKARDRNTGDLVAIKTLLPPPITTQTDVVRFHNEYGVMSALWPHWSGIVPVYRFGQDEHWGLFYYTMKHMLGGSLSNRLAAYASDPHLAAQMLVSIARTVAFAHQHEWKIVHCDLKPKNILFDEHGRAYVSDFGLAKQMMQGGADLTRTRDVAGSFPYMSPEQAHGKGEQPWSEAVDVYGLGAILYAALTGRPPFDDDDPYETLRKVREAEPERPGLLNARVPARLEAICLRCLEKAPERRYPSARALAEDLEAFVLGKPSRGEASSILPKQWQEVTIAAVRLRARDPSTLRPFRVGSVELPVTRLVGGDGEVRYTYPDGILCAPRATRFALPAELERVREERIRAKEAAAAKRNAVFENRPMVRLDDYRPGLSLVHDRPWPLHLNISLTDFFQAQLTNGSIDEPLPGGESLRTMYAGEPDDLLNSRLANPLTTNLSLVTSDGIIYVARRSTKVATNPGGWGPAVSGTGNPILDVINPELGDYSPFQQALREAYEEATAPYTADLSEITFFGLARRLDSYYPFLFGELKVKLTSRQLESQLPGDSWETRGLVPMPFTIDAVTDWIAEEYRKLLRREIPGGGVYTAIFSLLASLAYEYPGEDNWQEVIRRLTFDTPIHRPAEKP